MLHSPPDFSHSLYHPQSNWAPLVLLPEWMGLSKELSCEAGSFSCCCLNTPSPRVFSIRGLRLYFPVLEPWVAQSAALPTSCLVYLCANVGPQGLLVVRLPALFVPHSSSLGPAMAMRVLSTPPTGLDVCFFLSTWCQTSLPFDFLSVLVVGGGALCLPM